MEEISAGGRLDLPLHIDRQFRPWRYEVSHRRLVFRGSVDEMGETIDVVFLDVLGMKIRHKYDQLLIADADDRLEIDEFVDVPERHDARYVRLTVSDGVHVGFVVCASVHIVEGNQTLDGSSGPFSP
ncbi:hypothetical protein [Dactylosporangium sp. CA-092794]|uniref:hypothetical protein n=1 Tax=Dactylosporangium sp. CA-092794 TaxID=3239929 RepID=UPI003D8C80D4